MWDILGKKTGGNSGKVLNEREIQEKLYGKYRVPQGGKITASQKSDSGFKSDNSFAAIAQADEPRPLTSSTAEARSVSGDALRKIISGTSASANSSSFNKFNPNQSQAAQKPVSSLNFKLFSRLINLKIFSAIILVILLSLGVQKVRLHLKENHSARLDNSFLVPTTVNERARQDSIKPVILTTDVRTQNAAAIHNSLVENSQPEPTTKLTQPSARELPASQSNSEDFTDTEVSADSGKPFAVQVCTYRLETDAKKLVARLRDENLNAFYQGSGAKSGKPPRFFIVYTERAATYQEAQSGLLKFKQSVSAKDFPDAFIRKL